MRRTIRFTRRHLPHWEVEGAEYFVTVRCADSLPKEAVLRLAEIHRTRSAVTPGSAEFVGLQRQLFRSLEKFLDAGHGSCPLRLRACAEVVVNELAMLAEWKIDVPHYTIMPNHWHALLTPRPDCSHELSQIMKRVKGRSARKMRELLGGHGPVWQREWFDRWIRDETERYRVVDYIHQNPVKANQAADWTNHPWTK